ncbi:MAG: divalent-cation tolerance protein CutA [FCB group bacterium]|nr:divalent-cation tolerance protein CutA [FCB group bacterium]
MSLLILTAINDVQSANRFAADIVRNRLAACVNILPKATSIYWWQDKIVTEEEWVLLIKTVPDKLDSLKKYLMDHHPYDVPEIAAIHLEHLNPDYRRWLTDALSD